MLAPLKQPDPDAMVEAIADLPGGKWLLPHYEEGPYHLVPVVEAQPNAPKIVTAVLAAYPAVCTLPLWNSLGGFEPVAVHAMPQFAYEVLLHHNGNAVVIEEDSHVESPVDVRETDVAEIIPTMLGRPAANSSHNAELIDALYDAITDSGLSAVATLLANLSQETLYDSGSIVAAVQGVLHTS